MTDRSERLNAALGGRYRIERELGEGGMATVYLAEDLKHGRRVALKVLKPELAAVVGAERFLAEIRVTANLQHPHILPLHDSGEADGLLYYVMPYVEGESLRGRLDREQQLPVGDAVRIATKVAGALEYAHGRGVIHRDIKPANVLVQAGEPVVSDFGIALAVSALGGDKLTETGLSLGTPHYMSPEQATADSSVGVTTDIYALGCVLYEMLVGEPPYTGRTAQAVLGKIITGRAPSARAERPSVPANVDAAIRRALEKVPADRFQSSADFAKALENPAFRHGSGVDAAGVGAASASGWKRAAQLLGALALVLAVGLAWLGLRPGPTPTVERYALGFRPGQVPDGGFIKLSPDGSTLAYMVRGEDGVSRIMLRRWGELDAVAVEGTEGARRFVWSDDGSELAFDQDDETKVIGVEGGVPRPVRPVMPAGVTLWSGGTIYKGLGNTVLSVPATGGQVDTVTSTDLGTSYFRVALVAVLPGGDHGLVTKGEGVRWDLHVVDLRTGELDDQPLVRVGGARGAAFTPTGHIVYRSGYPEGALVAAPFDLESRALGIPVLLVDRVTTFSISENGTLFYSVNYAPPASSTPIWVDRSGAQREVVEGWEPEPTDPIHASLALSPDGSSLVVSVGPNDLTDLWSVDLPTGARRRITDLDAGTRNPRWSDDGRRMVFLSQARGGYTQWSMRMDRVSEPAPLIWLPGRRTFDGEFSPDGNRLVYRLDGDLYSVDLGEDGSPVDSMGTPIRVTPYSELNPDISPDGRWLAYGSDEPGQSEVFVQPWPNTDGQLQAVSVNGGSRPRWSPAGGELFYWSSTDSLVAVRYDDSGGRFNVRERRALFAVPSGPGGVVRGIYDVSPDGQSFVMRRINPVAAADWQYVRVENFFEELRRAVPN